MSLTSDDLDAIDAAPAKDDIYCVVCCCEWWNCLCSPAQNRTPTAEELEKARDERRTRAERGAA